MALTCGIIFISAVIYHYLKTDHFVPTSEYKYPPRIYYLAYALSATLILWTYREIIVTIFSRLHLLNSFKFIGSHTYWLYLWHIPFVDVVGSQFSFLLRFFIIFGGALLCVIIQDYIVNRYVGNKRLTAIFNG